MIKIKPDHTYLITGASGFLGERLTERVLREGGRVRALARNEGNLLELLFKHSKEGNRLELITGDVADPFTARRATEGVTGVFHLAAFKHVGLAERQPYQCTESNVMGTLNLLRETVGYNKLEINKLLNDRKLSTARDGFSQEGKQSSTEFMLSISTDKAAQVAGVYGATKLLMERLVKEFEEVNPATQYRVVRYGNVLYSTGSVLCKWKDLLEQGKEVIVTDLEATRFYWTIDQAIDLIFDCMERAVDSTPYCPAMRAVTIKDLLKAMHVKYGTKVLQYKEIGLQPGENKHEKVLDKGPYSNEVEQYTIDELIEMI